MLDPLFDVVAGLLALFYSWWPSYGVSIALLTLTAMIAVTPLTLKMTRSTLQMQQYAPELKRIQQEHRGDRQALNEATMAFYREHNFNPLGCMLPLLVQGPIFLVMYRVVSGLTRRSTEIGTQLGFTSFTYADTDKGVAGAYGQTPIAKGELTFDPDFLSRADDLYVRLSDSTEMVSWGVDLARSASSALSDGPITSLPYFLMIAVVLATGIFQHRQIQSRQTGAAVNPQQQMIMKIFPYFLPVICFSMPAAVVIYFIVSNAVRIVQQAYITRSFYRGEDSLGAQVAKRRSEAEQAAKSQKSSKQSSAKALTERKGAPTPKRDAKSSGSGRAPSRNRGAASRQRPKHKGGITGRAPTRGRSATSRSARSGSGRTTAASGSGRSKKQSRAKNAKKRR